MASFECMGPILPWRNYRTITEKFQDRNVQIDELSGQVSQLLTCLVLDLNANIFLRLFFFWTSFALGFWGEGCCAVYGLRWSGLFFFGSGH